MHPGIHKVGEGSGFRWSSDGKANEGSFLTLDTKWLQFLEEIFAGPSNSLTSNRKEPVS